MPLVALGALGLHAMEAVGGRVQGWAACVADPVAHAGIPVVLPLHDLTTREGATLGLSQSWRDIPVVVDGPLPAELAVGDVVSVHGVCAGPPARVAATELRTHPLRPWKEGLGVVGLALWLLSLPWALRRGDGGLVLRGDRTEATWPTS